ncbi:5206_t:CDS:2 [Gigaspora rosea]|nr:5206_t:CDS:2 [Gigaspora rosea]
MDQNFDINLVNNLVNSLDCNISSSKNSFWTYTDGSLIHEVNRCLWVEVGEEHELATRPFLKKIFETWNGTNWRLTESILALEPEANNSNKKFATQLKCLLGKLPVLKTLVTRRPDIYSSDSCIAYNTSISETQDHLAECSYYKTTWQNIENTAIDLVWSKFTKEEKFRCPKHLFPQNTN